MKHILYIAATMLLCSSCFHVNTNWTGGKNTIKGEGAVISKSFDLKDFDKIVINGFADATFRQGETFDVTLRTQENIFDRLDYRVEGTTLIIETKDKVTVRAEEFDLSIQAPALESFTVNGAGDFDIQGGFVSEDNLDILVNGAGDLNLDGIRCKDLTIEANGAADIDLSAIDVQKIKIELNGAGDVNVAGKAESASLEVNGAGDIDARDLKVAGEVKKRSSGLAKIQL